MACLDSVIYFLIKVPGFGEVIDFYNTVWWGQGVETAKEVRGLGYIIGFHEITVMLLKPQNDPQ